MTQLALRMPAKPAFDLRLADTTWPFSLEAYEALDALDRWEQQRINGKCFRRVAGDAQAEKLFWVRNRPPGMQDIFPLADAARFAVAGELVPEQPRGYQDVSLSMLAALWPMLSEYEGFIADEDCIEVRQQQEPRATWFVPVRRLYDFPAETVVSGPCEGSLRILRKGEFGLRRPHRERGGAAFYTPDVLAECLTKYTLEEVLKTTTRADDILGRTLCDPCMGANAIFLIQASLQLAHAYLERKQRELGEHVPVDRFVFELRKVQLHFLTNQTYGVELDPGAAEIARMCMRLAVLP